MLRKFTGLSLFFIFISLLSFSQQINEGGNPFAPPDKIVKVFPNPASYTINIAVQNNNDKQYDFIVYNFMGKQFDDIKVSGRTTLNLDKYYSGIYIYQLRDLQGNILESGKFNVIK
ncbi:MAG TPA: T9SS type A sorting domain-containing protein [Chitinophagaceae bacterium]|nr:T9SS type A sorting domain-containing protein [Chitinophagaceae bacterium]